MTAQARGGAWLFERAPAAAIFTREKLTDEHRLIGQTVDEFMEQEVIPAIDRLEQKDWKFARELLKKAADLGLLGTDVPEEYGGLGLDKVSSLIVGESVGRLASFATTHGGQTGLSITPLLLFGTPEQKQKYLPRLVSAEIVGAYALSESGSGSDALGAKAKATRQPDGSYVLNGEKMWITNGGFADIFIVFAKVDGEHFTAFIVERGPGVASGNEEHKMGLHGSSTTPLILQEALVPAENVLGEVGKGHKVAFNVLNYGRFKLGAMCSGGARDAIGEAARYAAQRKQFGKPIASFGAIRHKLGEMAIRQFAVESMLYRTAGLIEARLETPDLNGPAAGERMLAALEEFAIESSIVKVASSEAMEFILDENVQIHGGNGFVRDYPAERRYRDARVNRIFEGTNEINRMLIPGMLIRRAAKGGLPPVAAVQAREGDGAGGPIAAMKRTALMVLGAAMATYGDKLNDEQEVLMAAADILIDIYAAESSVLRAEGTADGSAQRAAAEVFVSDAVARVEMRARTALSATIDGDRLRTSLDELRRMMDVTPPNTVALRRRVAEAVIERRAYPF